MLQSEQITTADISKHVGTLQKRLMEQLQTTCLRSAEILNPSQGLHQARFLAFRSPEAQRWSTELEARNCITDVRGDVLRVGLGLYHDDDDIERFATLARMLH
jgi:selenocysteine lyase/cysteine desulfurase